MISTVSRNMQCLIASGLTIYFATRRFGSSADLATSIGMEDKQKRSTVKAAILQKLEAYGDSVVEKIDHVKRKKGKKLSVTQQPNSAHKSDTVAHQCPAELLDGVSARSRRRKKKKKAAKDVVPEMENKSSKQDGMTGKTGEERHIETMRQELGLVEFKTMQERQRKCEQHEKVDNGGNVKGRREPEVVVFTSHRKKHLQPEESSQSGESAGDNPEFSMKHARFEVQKFGIKGFHGDEKDAAMTALLLQLGAKPPKNKYENYRELQATRKAEIQAQCEKKELDRKLGFKVMNSSDRNRKRRKDKNDIGHIDGQVGRFRRGVQSIKKDDIIGIKKSKIK